MDQAVKVIIAGHRKFNNYQLLAEKCNHYLQNVEVTEIVSGKAAGADYLGEVYAKRSGYPVKGFPADWQRIKNKPAVEIGKRGDGQKYWKLAGHVRNVKMAEYADALIAFWDGKSTGTKDMIDEARKAGLKIAVVRIKHNKK